MVEITWSQYRFRLLPERALHWLDGDALIIADPHFGKAAAFRSVGIPVPAGTTQANLDRLDSALNTSGASRLIIVGDFLHARAGRTDQTMTLIENWRHGHPQLEIVLVRGNHDLHAGDPPAEWNIRCVDEPFIDGHLAFVHAPKVIDKHPVIAGHVHPCIRMHDVDGSSHRAPCFLLRRNLLLLPALGSFTGNHQVRPRKGEKVFVVGPFTVKEIPAESMIRT